MESTMTISDSDDGGVSIGFETADGTTFVANVSGKDAMRIRDHLNVRYPADAAAPPEGRMDVRPGDVVEYRSDGAMHGPYRCMADPKGCLHAGDVAIMHADGSLCDGIDHVSVDTGMRYVDPGRSGLYLSQDGMAVFRYGGDVLPWRMLDGDVARPLMSWDELRGTIGDDGLPLRMARVVEGGA